MLEENTPNNPLTSVHALQTMVSTTWATLGVVDDSNDPERSLLRFKSVDLGEIYRLADSCAKHWSLEQSERQPKMNTGDAAITVLQTSALLQTVATKLNIKLAEVTP